MMKTKVIIVIGPPGSGKGTQCHNLAKNLNMIHLSTGDLCRDAVKQNTDLGKQVGEYIRQGSLVPDELMINVIEQRLTEPDAIHRGVLLDGYPRTVKQATNLLSKNTIRIDRVILLQVPNNVCLDRITTRRVDSNTNISYSTKYQECGYNEEIASRLIQRAGDGDINMIQNRLNYYYMNLGHVLQNFKGKIFVINGSNLPNPVTQDILKIINTPIIEQVQQVQKEPQEQQEQTCAVCMSEPANFLVIPCGHQCGCETCLSEILGSRSAKCPICRKKMDGLVQVFRSGIIDNNTEIIQIQDSDPDPDQSWSNHDALLNQNLLVSAFEKNMSDQLQISINPTDTNNNTHVAVTIKTPDINILQRVPVDICCVIDVSGSMALDATFQDPNDESKKVSEGLTILDIVKHSVKTVICTLTDQDRLSIVAFSSQAKIVFALTEMTDNGKQLAITALEKLSPDGQTDIWSGLEAGLNSIKEAPGIVTGSIIPRKKNVFLLTDGQPTNTPLHGEQQALQQYFENNQLKCQIHTFGFGYNLKSDLLLNLAINGSFSFIPDAKIVGTCFVNAVSNICTTFTQNCVVYLVPKNGSTFTQNNDPTPYKIINLGPLQYGQTRDIIVNMSIPQISDKGKEESEPQLKKLKDTNEYLEVIVSYGEVYRVVTQGTNREITVDAINAYVRNQIVTTVYDIINKCGQGQGLLAVNSMKALTGEITAILLLTQDIRISKLLEDVQGRMSKAISTPERFNRWGQHYLRAIIRAHELQLCTNFMDPGLQIYGGNLFSELRDQGGKIFLSLELKKSYNIQNVPQSTRVISTQSYVNTNVAPSNNTYFAGNSGGCFDESCTVQVIKPDGTKHETKILDIRKNDVVSVVNLDGSIGTAVIKYIVRMDYNDQDMIKFLDTKLMLTKKHPIRLNGKLDYPINLLTKDTKFQITMATSDYLYNFVLDKTHVLLLVNDIECVTFGHQIKEMWHPFYASTKVVQLVEGLSRVQQDRFVTMCLNK